jgi:hypothetical protein
MYLFMHKYLLIYISHLAVPKIRVNLCPFVVSETEPKSTALFRIIQDCIEEIQRAVKHRFTKSGFKNQEPEKYLQQDPRSNRSPVNFPPVVAECSHRYTEEIANLRI